jgi:hypothetical protein
MDEGMQQRTEIRRMERRRDGEMEGVFGDGSEEVGRREARRR